MVHSRDDFKAGGVLVMGTVVLFLAVLGLVGCTGPEPEPEPEQPFDERVLARWDYLIERDFEAAWEYFSPGYRQTHPVTEFAGDMGRRPIRWHEAELAAIDCPEDDLCDVRVRVVYSVTNAPQGMSRMRIPMVLDERWVRLEGQWWYSAN